MTNAGDQPGRHRPSILVCGWAGSGNVGDELLTSWVVEQIEKDGGQVLLATRSFEDTRRRHPTVTPVRWGPRQLGVVARGVDGICLGPGGILQDNTSIWSLPGHLVKPVAGRLRGLPVAGVGLGAEPLRRASSRWLLRRAFAGAVGVAVRDRGSAAALGEAGIVAEVGADIVFGLEPLGSGYERGEIVVAVGPTLRPGRLLPVARRLDASADDVDAIVEAVDALALRLGTGVAVVPFRGAPDLDLGRRLVDRLDRADRPARLVAAEPDDARAAIAGARLVISARYHAAVLALLEGVPVLVRSDQAKLAALAAEVGDPTRIAAAPSWPAVADADVAERFGSGIAPGSVQPHREVLGRLVAAARSHTEAAGAPPRHSG